MFIFKTPLKRSQVESCQVLSTEVQEHEEWTFESFSARPVPKKQKWSKLNN